MVSWLRLREISLLLVDIWLLLRLLNMFLCLLVNLSLVHVHDLVNIVRIVRSSEHGMSIDC